MRKISEQQHRQLVKLFESAIERETSAMITVLSAWGRESEIPKLHEQAEIKKQTFKNVLG